MKLLLVGALCGLFNGLFGSGGGAVAVLSLKRILHIPAQKAHATALALILPLTLVSAAIYLFIYETNVSTALWITLGGVFGGVAGACLLNKISPKWLHKIFGGLMIFAAVRMLL